MDPRHLRYFNSELRFMREMGGEFAREFPKIAGRLGMDGFEVADPYVERLLEGFAFLTARVQLKLDDEFPKFTQHLLDMIYPHYLSPTPSMTVVQFRPNPREGALAAGVKIPRASVLRSLIGKDEQTACEYRTAHETTLWPLEMALAEFRSNLSDLSDVRLSSVSRARSALRMRLRATAGLNIDQLALKQLPLFLRGDPEISGKLYEMLLGHVCGVLARPVDRLGSWTPIQHDPAVSSMGFDDDQALLPYGPRSFQGYRLLHEYFAFPQRFLFVELNGLEPAIRRCPTTEIDIVILFDSTSPSLENNVAPANLALFCSPAANVFPRRADRVHLTHTQHEYHIVPDRTRPLDFEVHSVLEAVGHGANSKRSFLPFYGISEQLHSSAESYYSLRREQRKLSERQRTYGARSSYVGSEVFVSLVDADEGPFSSDLKQLALETLCTNRDLPLHMPLGQGTTDFTLDCGAPVESVRCVAGPSVPRPSHAQGDTSWRLISHLSTNYMTLADSSERKGAESLRELLMLYADLGEATVLREIESVLSVSSAPIIRQLPLDRGLAFGRGIEVSLTCDEAGIAAGGVFLLSAVLDRFFARYVSINSFTETVLRTIQRGEIMRWPPRIGKTSAI